MELAAPTEITLSVPASLESWVQAPISKRDFPSFQLLDEKTWMISTSSTSSSNASGNGSAGGMVWALPKALDQFRISWGWKVIDFPKQESAGIFSFLTGKPDDSALRVGLVFDSGNKNFPETETTVALRKSAEMTAARHGAMKAAKVSSVVFFNSSDQKKSDVSDRFPDHCTRASLSRFISYCPIFIANREANSNNQDIKTMEIDSSSDNISSISNFSGSLVALWIFADSDDSMSSSRAIFRLPEIRQTQK